MIKQIKINMKMMFKAFAIVLVVILIPACNSMKVDTGSIDKQIQPHFSDLSIYDFNKKFEYALNNRRLGFMKKVIKPEPIKKFIKRRYLSEKASVLQSSTSGMSLGVPSDIGQISTLNMVKVLGENSTKFNWIYLYSLYDKKREATVSLYRISGEDRLQYIKFYFDENRQLVDLHISAYKYSDFDLIVKLLVLPFMSGSKDGHQYDVIGRIAEHTKDVDFVKLESDFKTLDDNLKNSDVFYDYVLKLLGTLKEKSAQRFVNLIQEYMDFQSFLLQPYLESNQTYNTSEEKIKYLEYLIDFTQGDSSVLSELSLTYAHVGNFKSALALGKQAVIKSPEDEEVFWAFLEVTILSGRFDLSTKVLRVLNEKFELALNDENLATLDQYPNFIESKLYKTWLSENKVPVSQ